jgi:hypothetical protein
MLQHILTLLSVASPLSLMIALWMMAQISRRFGEVTHRPPLYRGFYVALGLLALPLVTRLLAIGQTGYTDRRRLLEALFHDLPMALGITLAVIVAWRYWGWLVYAREGQTPASPRQRKS